MIKKTKILLKCDDLLWEKLKEITPRAKTMQEAVENLIREKVGENE